MAADFAAFDHPISAHNLGGGGGGGGGGGSGGGGGGGGSSDIFGMHWSFEDMQTAFQHRATCQ